MIKALLSKHSVFVAVSVFLMTACDAGSTVRGSWKIEQWTSSFAPNLECNDLDVKETTDAGKMVFDDVPHPEGIGEHTLTYHFTKAQDLFTREFVEFDAPDATAGWDTPPLAESPSGFAGFNVIDPFNASISGDWFIAESGIGTVHLQHSFGVDEGGGAESCTIFDFVLAAQ